MFADVAVKPPVQAGVHSETEQLAEGRDPMAESGDHRSQLQAHASNWCLFAEMVTCTALQR
jgi:hypothetical protein